MLSKRTPPTPVGAGTAAAPNARSTLSKHLLTEASWIRLSFNGDAIYSNKTATANWADADLAVDGWSKLGVKIIVRAAFHPPDLTDAEILPWIVEFNRQILERYCNKPSPASARRDATTSYSGQIVGLQPVNEPWFDDEYAGDSTGWAYQYKRLGASHNIRASIWKSGYSGTTTNELLPEAVAWMQKLRDVLVGVHHLAATKGIKVYGPHWSSPNYVDVTRVSAQLGVLDGVDVFTFGCLVEGEPLGPHIDRDGWATYIDDILPMLGGKPWACVEFPPESQRQHHQPAGLQTRGSNQARRGTLARHGRPMRSRPYRPPKLEHPTQ